MYCPDCKTEEGTPHKPGCFLNAKFPEKSDVIVIDEEVATKEEVTPALTNGDCHDGDSGTYLGTLSEEAVGTTEQSPTLQTLPASLSLFFNGNWYIYKMDHREEEIGDYVSKSFAGEPT